MGQHDVCERVGKKLLQEPVIQNRFFLAVIVTLAATTPIRAATSAVLVDLDLKPHSVNIQSMAEGLISYFDTDRRLRVEPMDQFVQVRQIGYRPVEVNPKYVTYRDTRLDKSGSLDDSAGMIALIDGQRLAGRWGGGDASGEKLIWHHPLLGRVALDLNQIAGVAPRGRIPRRDDTPSLRSDDRVLLMNGDTLDGFVSGIDSTGLLFQPNGHEKALVLPIARLRLISLANGTDRYRSNRYLVWLTDGSCLETRSIKMTSDQVLLEPVLISGTPTRTVPVDGIVRIDLALADKYLVDLVDLPMQVTAGGSALGLPVPPRVAGASVWMHAPVTVVYDLPDQAVRFYATVVVAGGREPSVARAWTDFEVRIHAADQIMSHCRLNVKQGTATINTALLGRKLTIELVAADNGPIMDRMLLHNAVVLVRQSPVVPAR